MKKISAGLLMYRYKDQKLEFFIVHPGGPFYQKRDQGCWGIPKGLVESGEDLFETAKREFMEETGFTLKSETTFIELEPAVRPDKIVHVWAFEDNVDPKTLKSNNCTIEWPPRSGKIIEIPEVDRGDFFPPEEVKIKVYPYLLPLFADLEKKLYTKDNN